MLSIQADETSDNAIGNVTGSNSVNVFLGLGLPWTMAAIYWSIMGHDEVCHPPSLLASTGRGNARANDAQGTPTQSHISPSILVYEKKKRFH